MNSELIKYFIAVAQAGSANAAAKQLGVNHTTIIRKIEQLEQELELPLFTRSHSGYQLSQFGSALLPKALRVEEAAFDFQRQAHAYKIQPEGLLRLSLPENALLDLSASLARFAQAYPHIQLELDSSGELANLNKMEADIALRLTNTPPDYLVGRKIADIEFGVYAHANYLQQWPSTPTTQQCHWILWKGVSTSLQPEAHNPDHLLEQEDIGPVIMRSSHVADILSAIKQGCGVGLLEHQTAERHALVQLPFQDLLKKHKLDHAGLWVLRHKDMVKSEPIKAFVNFIQQDSLKM